MTRLGCQSGPLVILHAYSEKRKVLLSLPQLTGILLLFNHARPQPTWDPHKDLWRWVLLYPNYKVQGPLSRTIQPKLLWFLEKKNTYLH